MLKYPCLVLDHDDTIVQSMKTLSYPFFVYILDKFRPGATMSQQDFILNCHNLGFADLCRQHFHFTDAELADEHQQWMAYIRTHIPAPYPGVRRIIEKQKQEGGLICVVSHSSIENITRDYAAHFGIQPDAIYGWDLPQEQRKPSTFPLVDIMEKYRLKPEEILVVDDMKLACRMAKPLGVKIAYAHWDDMGVPELEAEMENLCDYTFRSPEELYRFLYED